MIIQKLDDSDFRRVHKSFQKLHEKLHKELRKQLQKSSLFGKFKLSRADRGIEEIELNICGIAYKRVNKL